MRWILVAAIVLCTAEQARANAIIPFMVVPYGLVFLFPLVVPLEAIVLRFALGGKVGRNLLRSFLANAVSTLLGAVLFVAIWSSIGEGVYDWWGAGGFAAERPRAARISVVLAIVLWAISWISETEVILRMRDAPARKRSAATAAVANLVTYALLLFLALWLDRPRPSLLPDVDKTRSSASIGASLLPDDRHPVVGFWKWDCANDFGLAIEASEDRKYTVSFCGRGGCDPRGSNPPISLETRFRIVDEDTIEEVPQPGQPAGTSRILHRCDGGADLESRNRG